MYHDVGVHLNNVWYLLKLPDTFPNSLSLELYCSAKTEIKK